MDRLGTVSYTTSRLLAVTVVLSLLFSFGLHAVQIQHEHFAVSHSDSGHAQGGEKSTFGWETLETAFHTSDKKLFLALVGGLFVQWAFLSTVGSRNLLLFADSRTKKIYRTYGNRFRTFDYLSLYFRKGIFHPKAY